MKQVIVLAMHGAPPKDFPKGEMAEFFALQGRLKGTTGPEKAALEENYAALEAKIRAWPRTPLNDPFWAGAEDLAQDLRKVTGLEVIVGYIEFCAPSLDEALDQAVSRGAQEVIVTTPMMTRGGDHAAIEIPEIISRVQERHPQVHFIYAWPFSPEEVARFLAAQINKIVTYAP